MELINKNEAYLNDPGGYYLLDLTITRFDIYLEQGGLLIDVYLSLPHYRFKEVKCLKLHLVGVKEYERCWNNLYSFNVIERYQKVLAAIGTLIYSCHNLNKAR